jgi:hypothetical protein
MSNRGRSTELHLQAEFAMFRRLKVVARSGEVRESGQAHTR